jgi:hypothetical protein
MAKRRQRSPWQGQGLPTNDLCTRSTSLGTRRDIFGLSKVPQVTVEISAPPNFADSVRQQPGEAAYAVQTIGYRIAAAPNPSRYMYEFLVDGHVLARNLARRLPMGGNRIELEIVGSQDLGVEYIAPQAIGGPIFNPNLFLSSNLSQDTPARELALRRLAMARLGIEIIQNVLSSKVFLIGAGRGIRKGSLNQKFKTPDVGRGGQHTLQVLSTVFAKPEYRKEATPESKKKERPYE